VEKISLEISLIVFQTDEDKEIYRKGLAKATQSYWWCTRVRIRDTATLQYLGVTLLL